MNSPEEVAGIIEHDPWIASFADQLRYEISHASVALSEGFRVVVIALSLVLNHVLQMGNHFSTFAGRDRWLMHVQSTGERRADPLNPQICVLYPDRLAILQKGMQIGFTAGDRWRLVLGHDLIRTPSRLGRHLTIDSAAHSGSWVSLAWGPVVVSFRDSLTEKKGMGYLF